MNGSAPPLTGFGATADRRLRNGLALVAAGLLGGAVAGPVGTGVGVLATTLLVLLPWRGRSAGSWAVLRLRLQLHPRRSAPVVLPDPVTISNNHGTGGVRLHAGTAAVAVRLLGRAHRVTVVTGAVRVSTDNVIDVATLTPLLRHALGLVLDSLSVVSAGMHRSAVGDYPRVYDSEVGIAPYAGQRETWLILRLRVLDNAAALHRRPSLGGAALAAGQRVAAALRCQGLRARVGTAAELAALDDRFGGRPGRDGWRSVPSAGGFLTGYGYPPAALTGEGLAQAWTLPVDGVIQNVTLRPGGTATATVTVRTPRPPAVPPAVLLRRLTGEQAALLRANLCADRPRLRGLRSVALPGRLPIEIGPSGVLVGRLANGDRLMVPLTDGDRPSRVFVAAADPITKRLIIRAAATGERICVHTRDPGRWAGIRMPDITITDDPQPAPDTTLSVVDGTVSPAPRPAAVLTVAAPGRPAPPGDAVEVAFEQVGPAELRVTIGTERWLVTVELFRAENRYCNPGLLPPAALPR